MAEETKGYGQCCPIARAAEILGERWSLLIVRDLLVGSTRFNDLARGLPGLSRSLLTKRAEVSILAKVWLGRIAVTDALRSGAIEFVGQRQVVDALPRALELSPVAAAVQRAQAGAPSR